MIPAPAALAAAHRVRESERADALFRDPCARALIDSSDSHLARILGGGDPTEWFFAARTVALDRLLAKEVAAGADLVINLAAGLDARPYRLAFPPSLRWAEVDSPEVLEHKAGVLAGAEASCRVEQHPIDLDNRDARRGLFRDLAKSASRAVVLSEQLFLLMMAGDAVDMARDLLAPPAFTTWIADVVSPALLTILNEQHGEFVRQWGAPFLMAPRSGPAFFETSGWRLETVRALIPLALKLERLPVALRMTALVRDAEPYAHRPWAGACLFRREALEPRVE